MYRDTHLRSILKAVSWRISGTIATAAIVFAFTQKLALAVTVSVVEFASKIGLFFIHERIWDAVYIGKRAPEAKVLWFTGLSGAGKSTIADQVYEELKRKRLKVERLDGDSVRDIFPSTGFSRRDREEHVKRIGFLASKLEQNGVFVICSFISPYKDSRDFVRQLCKNFVEIYVSTSLEECEKRDVKGLYAKARKGEIKNFTGLDDPYEPPARPEIEINTANTPLDKAVKRVISYIEQNQ